MEVKLKNKKNGDGNNFLVVKETLTRIGSASGQVLTQPCFILFKKDRYYIVHYKELLRLDGQRIELTQEDLDFRDSVIRILEEFNLLESVNEVEKRGSRPKIIPHSEKSKWTLTPLYEIGKMRN